MGNFGVSANDSVTQQRVKDLLTQINANDSIPSARRKQNIAAADSANVAKLTEYLANANKYNGNVGSKGDFVTNTEDNIFLKEYIEGRAASEGIQIPQGMKIKISNYQTGEARDIYSGNLLKGDVGGIQRDQYWSDLSTYWYNKFNSEQRPYKKIEDFCKDKGLNDEQTEKVLELYRFHDVRVNIFKARIKDMFSLLSKERADVEKRVAQMKISVEQKQEIMQVKDFLDRYYKVEAEYNGKTYNLLNLSEEDKKEIGEKSLEFAKFLEKISPELRKHSATFAQKEMQSEELTDAGQSSQWIAWPLLAVLGTGVVKGLFENTEMKEGMKNSEAFAKFIKENPQKGNEILDKCVAKFNKLSKNGTCYVDELAEDQSISRWGKVKNFGKKCAYKAVGKTYIPKPKTERLLNGTRLMERYMKRIGFEGGEYIVKQKVIQSQGLRKWINPISQFKNARGGALVTLLLGTAALSMDDCMGAGKDFFQDQNNFGFGTGLGFAVAGAAGGILSSAAIVPTFQGIVDYLRSDKILNKMGVAPKRSMAEKLYSKQTVDNLKYLKFINPKHTKFLGETGRKLAGRGLVGTFVGGFLGTLGVVLASTSSGSSWTSMGLTRWLMGANGDELVEKNIIDEKDNGFFDTDRNMMEYDAYKGKAKGITYSIPTGDWFIGSTVGALGGFTHSNPAIQNTWTVLQGCSETLTASGYQVLGEHTRNSAIREQKQKLVESAKTGIN